MDFDPKKNYYDILGISEDASEDEVKKAFRKAAVQHHPDKAGGNAEKFKEANEAHQVLSDSAKRQQYDMYRKGGFGGAGFDGGFGGGGFDFGGFGGFGGGVDLGDLVGDLFGSGFGGGGGGRRVTRGEDIQVAMNISFEECFHGVEKQIAYYRYIQEEGLKEETCSQCNGRGKVSQQTQTPFGVMQVQTACPSCEGLGKTFSKDGKPVSNGGLKKHEEQLTVKIPSGIKDGVFIKFSNKGNEGIGGAGSGDLYIKIQISRSDKYERKEQDLYVKTTVSIFDMVLGGEVTIDHPDGKMKITIPKGTQVGDKIRVKNKGFGEKGIFSSSGDLYLLPQLEIPKKLSKEEEKLWKQLKDA